MVRAIIFDCDGVLFDTNSAKTKAFEAVAHKMGFHRDVVEAFSLWQRSSFGISRQVVFEKLGSGTFGAVPRSFEVARAVNEFGVRVRNIYSNEAQVPGLLDTLRSLADLKLSVASGGAQEEVRDAFAREELSKFFWMISGSPTPKHKLVRHQVRLLNDAGIATRDVVLVGDARADAEAAIRAGVGFIFAWEFSSDRQAMSDLAQQHNWKTIRSIEEIKDHLS